MYSLHTDKIGKKLVIIFKDHFDLQQAKQLYTELPAGVAQLAKGFSVLIDLSFLERMDSNARPFVEMAMDLLNKSGVSKIIRIIPDQSKDIGFNIMGLFHYSAGVVIHTYVSYQEAEEFFVK